VGIDASCDDGAIAAMAGVLSKHFNVSVSKLYQFSEEPPVKLIFDLALVTLQAIPGGVLGNWVYDGLKTLRAKLVSKRELSTITINLREPGHVISGHITGASDAVAMRALETIERLADRPPGGYVFDENNDDWRRLE
jgi:hypothetical protein